MGSAHGSGCPPCHAGVPAIPAFPEGPAAPGVASPLAEAPHGEGVPRLLSRPSAGGMLAWPPGCGSQRRPIPSGPRERCLLRRGVLVLWQRRGWSQGSANKASIPGAGGSALGAAFPAGCSSPVHRPPRPGAGSQLPALCLPCWQHVRGCSPLQSPCPGRLRHGWVRLSRGAWLPPAQRLHVSLAMLGTPLPPRARAREQTQEV